MKFLDLNGLTHFFDKVKTWIGNNYLSLTGGTVRGSVNFLRQGDGGSSITISPLNITKSGYNDNYLFASGKMIPIGKANGVAGLDANGNVPLAQLGNLDTTVAEVVTALPTTNIKKHIYLIEDEDGDTQNQYEEYLYTGDTSAAYDASKWEKLGDFRATVDLADYAKKSEAVGVNGISLRNVSSGPILKQQIVFSSINDDNDILIELENATAAMAGFMSVSDKNKLDTVDFNANNYILPFATNNTLGGIKLGYPNSNIGNGHNYPLYVDNEAKAYVSISMATPKTEGEGLMTGEDKTKLNGIASGATADSAITTGEIDALFA